MIEIRLVVEGNTPNHVHINVVDLAPVLDAIHQLGDTMAADLSAIQAAVAHEGTVVDSAIVLLKELAAAIRSNPDPAALQKLADDIEAKATALATAVTENTPAA